MLFPIIQFFSHTLEPCICIANNVHGSLRYSVHSCEIPQRFMMKTIECFFTIDEVDFDRNMECSALSVICRSVDIWSVHDVLGLSSAWFSLFYRAQKSFENEGAEHPSWHTKQRYASVARVHGYVSFRANFDDNVFFIQYSVGIRVSHSFNFFDYVIMWLLNIPQVVISHCFAI